MKKEVLIFGAHGALGKGITNTFLNKDYDKIYLFDFKIGNTGSNNPNVENIATKDLTKEENVIDALKAVKPEENKLLFLYSTIGGFSGGESIWETDVYNWDRMFDMNLKSSFLIAKHFSRIVRLSAGGSLCFTTAYTGIKAEPKKGAYGVSKSALIHLVKTLSIEGRAIKLTANAIAPFIIDTPPNREWMKDSDFSEWIKPEEVGELAHSIFSNFHFISGNVIELKERIEISDI